MKLLLLILGLVSQADRDPLPQGVDYRIEAGLDEATDVLRGRARVLYTNHSTQRLDTLFFHQHLNAFRPNSAWARRELEYGVRRFQDLGPDEHAFERLTSVTVDGEPIEPAYPGAPDSTVVAIPLPIPLAPGGSATVVLDWDARLATEPRRQGRRGRHHDFAQWYPRIAVFEDGEWKVQALLPQGEFYGEFASYDVTLEVAADQVIGSTGVPVEGEPGWAAAATSTAHIDYARGAYPPVSAEPLGLLSGEAPPDRRRVRWRAEDVHHFAWTTSPDYVYEGGSWRGVPLHVLYRPDEEAAASWANGEALARITQALEFMVDVFGVYPYPQLTAAKRIEPSGATEFPMLMMNSSGSLGQVVHEVAHEFAHAILANNEWAEAWLDEGVVEFVTSWFWDGRDPSMADWAAAMASVLSYERAGMAQPIGWPAARFRDKPTYNAMSYSKAMLVLRMLREYLGPDVMKAGLRRYFAENRFSHVTEPDLVAALEAESGEELDWFFDQWIHGTATLDYRLGQVSWGRPAGGPYVVRVEVIREGDAWMPVTLKVGSVERRLDSREPRQVVVVEVDELPAEVALDPDDVLIDLRPENDRRALEAHASR